MTIQEMQVQLDHALSTAETCLSAAERQKRNLTDYERQVVDSNLKAADALKPRITEAKANARTRTTAELRAVVGAPTRQPLPTSPSGKGEPRLPNTLSLEYHEAFHNKLSNSGPVSAALYEA